MPGRIAETAGPTAPGSCCRRIWAKAPVSAAREAGRYAMRLG